MERIALRSLSIPQLASEIYGKREDDWYGFIRCNEVNLKELKTH